MKTEIEATISRNSLTAQSFGTSLRDLIELTVPLLFFRWSALCLSPDWHSHYPKYLVALHSLIRASVPLMEAAASRCRQHGSWPDELEEYYRTHVEEERGHDTWILEDLEAMGYLRNDVASVTPMTCISELVGSQYYWILHHSPALLLGYIAVLEGYPASLSTIDQLASKTPYSPAAFRTLRKHAMLDPNHRADLDRLLSKIALTDEDKQSICQNAVFTIRKCAEMIGAVPSIRLKNNDVH